MNEAAARIVLERFLKGSFDILDALLSLSFTHEILGLTPMDKGKLADMLADNSVSFAGPVKENGALGMLLTVENASQLASLTLTGASESKTELEAEDVATLKEIADAFMGGGLSSLANLFGSAVEQFESLEVETTGAVESIESLFGDSVIVGEFTYSAGEDVSGKAYFLFDEAFESRVPDDAMGESEEAAADLAKDAEVSDEEMSEILSGFESGGEAMAGAGDGPAVPENIALILDIRLDVTVRLGTIEMPIGDVLNLGPGSIIEVGHLVEDPVELLVNEKLIARGDVVVVDEKFGLRITEVMSPVERVESLR